MPWNGDRLRLFVRFFQALLEHNRSTRGFVPVRTLAAEIGISRATAHRWLSVLRDEGFEFEADEHHSGTHVYRGIRCTQVLMRRPPDPYRPTRSLPSSSYHGAPHAR
jgi:predicted DNA-binding transcriptional regulator YafY